MCWDEVRKARAQLDPNLSRDAKNNKATFYRYIDVKRKVKENIPSLKSENSELITTDG